MLKIFHPHDYKIEIIKLHDGDQDGFEFYVPAFRAHIYGDTTEEALEGYLGYFDSEIKRRKKEGIPMPKPDSKPDMIRQVPLRIPQRVYQRISETAKKQGQSFNRFVVNLLEKEAEEKTIRV
ncbi:hypothetical protein HZA43_04770 [Candidatus Peregrinibacteria bacterium]|nr:hypothetical protein [Candidatus Peregrinibacteria bacterium]